MRSLLSVTGLSLAVAAATITACYSDGGGSDANVSAEAGTTSASGIPGRDCPERSPLTYQSFGAPFFLSYCTGCHSSKLPPESRKGAPPGLDFDTLAGIRSHAGRIYARAGDANTTMPPAGGPSAEQRKQLGDWLACGAPGDEQALAGKSLPPKETRPKECTDRPQPLPAFVLPRCSVATWECLAKCAVEEIGCEAKCIAADQTPPNTQFGTPFGCEACINYQEYACTDANGCHEVVAALECCQRDKCATSTDPSCTVEKCKSEAYAYGYCLGTVTPTCASLVDGPARQCFPKDLAIGDAGAD